MMTWLHINNLDQSCLFISDSKQSIFLDDISREKPEFILYLGIEIFVRRAKYLTREIVLTVSQYQMLHEINHKSN